MKENNHSEENQTLSRRSFGKIILGFLGTIAALEVGGISLAYLKSRGDQSQVGGLVLAGDIDEFTPGTVTAYQNEGFFLIRDENGDFLAVP